MKQTQNNHEKNIKAWRCPMINTISAVELNKKVIASACSQFYPECPFGFSRMFNDR